MSGKALPTERNSTLIKRTAFRAGLLVSVLSASGPAYAQPAAPGANGGSRLAPPSMGPGADALPPAAASLAPAVQPVPPRPSTADTVVVGRTGSVVVEAGHGRVVSLPGDAANVYVADPKIAEVRPASANSLFVFGTGVGGTTLAALDSAGGLVSQLQIAVVPATGASGNAASAMRASIPGVSARVTPSPGGLTIGGSAATPDAANRAITAARPFLPATQSVQNNLSVQSGTQVSLQVTIAEMDRNVTRELGVNWQALGTIGKYSIGFATANPFLLSSGLAALTSTYSNAGTSINNIINALAQDSLAKMLAQPNLTAMSGETASFLVGGEFPIPTADTNNTVTVTFKQYGISLAFVPTVLDSGRINVHVRTEVSALTQAGAVSVGVGNNSISIPALTVRRADTTIELGSGQSFAIAGLLQDTVTQQTNNIPGLAEIPVLGALFRSDSFQHNKSELVVIVTPVIEAPVDDRSRLHGPGENFVPANDGERFFLNRQQSRAAPAKVVPASLNGFILQ